MALINIDDLEPINKERNAVHSKVKATYNIFEIDGNKYFQIDTYGKSSRECKDKISQSIQLDETTAKGIVNLLKDIYGFDE